MKFRSLRKWEDIENSKALIFCAQMIDELLFEYTLDTYKPSAMNSSLLIIEALQVVKAVESGSIKRPNIKHVIDELCDSLDRDVVAEDLVKVDADGLKAILKDPKSIDASIYNCLKLLAYQVPLIKYKEANERLLFDAVVSQRDFPLVRSLTRSYITTLLNFGYSERYIQKKARDFFHYSRTSISGPDAILGFIEIFQNEPEEYKVLYKAPRYLEHFCKSAKKTWGYGRQRSRRVGDASK